MVLLAMQSSLPPLAAAPVWASTGKPADMAQLLANKYVVLVFHTGPHHSVAARLVRELAALQAAFAKLDCQLMAVSTDSVEALRAWGEWEEDTSSLQAASFDQMPILSDAAGHLASAFGLLRHGDGERAGYCNVVAILDRSTRLRYSSMLEAHTSHDPKHILRKVAAFRAVEAGTRLVMAGSTGGTNSIEAITVENDMDGIAAFYRKKYGGGGIQKPSQQSSVSNGASASGVEARERADSKPQQESRGPEVKKS